MVKKKQPEKKVCSKCEKGRVLNSFYGSNSPFFADGKVPICKTCLIDMVDYDNLEESAKSILRKIDKPFLKNVWNSSVKSDQDTFRHYIKSVNSLPQYKDLTNDDSDEEVEESINDVEEFGSIEINREIKARWGAGYTNLEYLKLEQFYQDMINSYDISTPPHKKILMQLGKLNLEQDKLLNSSDYTNYQKISKTYDDMLKTAGFRPIDRKSSDEAVGVRTFSQIFEEVEREGFIPPAPIEEHEDLVDRTLLVLMNYTRGLFNMEKLNDLPEDVKKELHGDD